MSMRLETAPSRVIYEDDDIVVMIAPHEDELEGIIVGILRENGRAMTVREIHSYLEATASEEKIRRTLYRLVRRGMVKQYHDGRYELLEGASGEPALPGRKYF